MRSPDIHATAARRRCSIRVRGTVQGVGFRPSMLKLASSLRLGGFIRNDAHGVLIEVEGTEAAVVDFVRAIPNAAPPLAHIESLETSLIAPCGDTVFTSNPSAVMSPHTGILAAVPPDLGPCADCLRELRDPSDRRYRHPFISCTACGPRLTIVRELPYDRCRTTMSGFVPCPFCREEYGAAGDRRYHCEANACPHCGPQLQLITRDGTELSRDDALRAAARAIAGGAIVAVKGIGGYALAVDARNPRAVAELRERKRRKDKPLALMVRSIDDAARIAVVTAEARIALESPARPIVLLPRRPGADLAENIAPRLTDIGIFLPPSPLQALLATDGPPVQVMTSGNVSEEPIARTNAEALSRLSSIADAFLLHDRLIDVSADDSVVRMIAGAPVPIRRARGCVPEPLPLPQPSPPALAVGGDLKSTICLLLGTKAVLSCHLGNLTQPECFENFVQTIDRLSAMFRVEPRAVAHDFHPDYQSTKWAHHSGLPLIPVQHHHAHVAACMAEHGRAGRVLGVAFDGTGYGSDGTLWGGEFLDADFSGFRRLGHLTPLPLPGGEAAVREPWRIGMSALYVADLEPALDDIDTRAARLVAHLLERKTSCIPATGAGRWFDAVAALVLRRHTISYEGQGAMELEALAGTAPAEPYPAPIVSLPGKPFEIDLRVMLRQLAADLRSGVDRAAIAARFHETMAQSILDGCRFARDAGVPAVVALTGGCFQNRRLTERALELLRADGFEVLIHRKVPPGDGGLSYGQAVVLAHRLQEES